MNEVAESLLALPNTDLLDFECSLLTNNDYGNGLRFVKRHNKDVLYVEAVGWFIYTDGYWRHKSAETHVSILASEICTHIMDEYNALGTVRGRDYFTENLGGGDIGGFRDELIKWAKKSGNGPQINALTKVAKAQLTVENSALDVDKKRLNLKNGTMVLDQYCIDLQPHNREDYITKQLDIEYDANAKCPKWMAFLERVIPDVEVQAFLQRYVGYCLTGDVSEQKFLFFYGLGANGKSVFVDTIASILGDYSKNLPFESFVKDRNKKGADATPDLAQLPGKRFVKASEAERGCHLAEAKIKAMTGGEAMSVRHLHSSFFEFHPEFKIILSGNHKPYISGTDEGIWRRICMVNFGENIPEHMQNKNLLSELWQERAGILNWMLGGCQLWHVEGLKPPKAIVDSTLNYRNDSDQLYDFVENWLEYAPTITTSVTSIRERYLRWVKDTGNEGKEWSAKGFSNAMSERKITHNGVTHYLEDMKFKTGGIMQYRGLRLKVESETAE